MFARKLKLFMLVLLLLITGCAVPAAVKPAPTNVNTPLPPAPTSSSTEAQVVSVPAMQLDGDWITNLGKVTFVRNDTEINMVIDGYGGEWHDISLKGILNGNEAVFEADQLLGDFTLVFDENTFKTKPKDNTTMHTPDSEQLSFCGVRSSEADELPAGCGFSGKWIIAASDTFPEGSYVVLKQVAGTVTGHFYDSDGNVFDTITGEVEWAKGWRLLGNTEKRGEIDLEINSAETGFQFYYRDETPNQLCAVREGHQSAYLFYFTCKP